MNHENLFSKELLPLDDDREKTRMDLILYAEPLPWGEENPNILEALEAIILKCLKKKVAERYAAALPWKMVLGHHFSTWGQQSWPSPASSGNTA